MENAPGFRVPIPRFGSSDCHRRRASHLFYSKRRPLFRAFQQRTIDTLEGVEVEQFIIRHKPARTSPRITTAPKSPFPLASTAFLDYPSIQYGKSINQISNRNNFG